MAKQKGVRALVVAAGLLAATLGAGAAAAQDFDDFGEFDDFDDFSDFGDLGGGLNGFSDGTLEEFLREASKRQAAQGDAELTISIEKPTSWRLADGDVAVGRFAAVRFDEANGVVRELEFGGDDVTDLMGLAMGDVETISMAEDVFTIEGAGGTVAVEDANPMTVTFTGGGEDALGILHVSDEFDVQVDGPTITLRGDEMTAILAMELGDGTFTVDGNVIRMDLTDGGEAILEVER